MGGPCSDRISGDDLCGSGLVVVVFCPQQVKRQSRFHHECCSMGRPTATTLYEHVDRPPGHLSSECVHLRQAVDGSRYSSPGFLANGLFYVCASRLRNRDRGHSRQELCWHRLDSRRGNCRAGWEASTQGSGRIDTSPCEIGRTVQAFNRDVETDGYPSAASLRGSFWQGPIDKRLRRIGADRSNRRLWSLAARIAARL